MKHNDLESMKKLVSEMEDNLEALKEKIEDAEYGATKKTPFNLNDKITYKPKFDEVFRDRDVYQVWSKDFTYSVATVFYRINWGVLCEIQVIIKRFKTGSTEFENVDKLNINLNSTNITYLSIYYHDSKSHSLIVGDSLIFPGNLPDYIVCKLNAIERFDTCLGSGFCILEAKSINNGVFSLRNTDAFNISIEYTGTINWYLGIIFFPTGIGYLKVDVTLDRRPGNRSMLCGTDIIIDTTELKIDSSKQSFILKAFE